MVHIYSSITHGQSNNDYNYFYVNICVGLLGLSYTHTAAHPFHHDQLCGQRHVHMRYAGIGIGHSYTVMMPEDNEDGEHTDHSNDDNTPDDRQSEPFLQVHNKDNDSIYNEAEAETDALVALRAAPMLMNITVSRMGWI